MSEPTAIPSSCVKCLGTTIGVRWHATFYDCLYSEQGRHDWDRDDGEHLHFTCDTCGFTWATAIEPAEVSA